MAEAYLPSVTQMRALYGVLALVAVLFLYGLVVMTHNALEGWKWF